MSVLRLHSGPRMSQAVIHGDTVYLAGQVDLDNPAATAGEQMARILSRIDDLLEQAGSSKSRLLSATIWLADINDLSQMNRVWDEWLPAGSAPARATVQANRAFVTLLVEVAVIAAVGTRRTATARMS